MSLSAMFDGMAGQQLPGGCDDCSAWQEITRQDGIHVITVHHDDSCPTWPQIRRADSRLQDTPEHDHTREDMR